MSARSAPIASRSCRTSARTAAVASLHARSGRRRVAPRAFGREAPTLEQSAFTCRTASTTSRALGADQGHPAREALTADRRGGSALPRTRRRSQTAHKFAGWPRPANRARSPGVEAGICIRCQVGRNAGAQAGLAADGSAGRSMPEVADAGEHHGGAGAVGGGDHLVVAQAAARLDRGRGAGLAAPPRGRPRTGRRHPRRPRCL